MMPAALYPLLLDDVFKPETAAPSKSDDGATIALVK